MLHPPTLQARELAGDWWIFVGCGAAVALIVAALIIYPVVRWRYRGHARSAQFKENVRLEIVYTAVPLALVAALFYPTYVREVAVERQSARPYAVVNVTGFQWSWRFQYPDAHVEVAGTPENPPTLVLPVARTTRINLTSGDVNHAFWIPEFLFKRDAIAGLVNHFDLTPTRTGTFAGVCAEYCGLDHAYMTFTVRVVPEQAYRRWLRSGGTNS